MVLKVSEKGLFLLGTLFIICSCPKSRKLFSCYMPLPFYSQGSHRHSKIYTNNLCAFIWRTFTNINLGNSWTVFASSFPEVQKPHFLTDMFKSFQCDCEFTNFFHVFLSAFDSYILKLFYFEQKEFIYSFLGGCSFIIMNYHFGQFNANSNLPNIVFNSIIYLISTLHCLVYHFPALYFEFLTMFLSGITYV